jgi:hypothetical protein
MRIRRIVQVLASSTVLTLAAGVSGPALAQSFEVPAPACQFSGSASEVLRRINETESSATLLKATSIFPCDVQSQFIEALGKEIGSGKDQSDLHSILDRALDKATTVEAACVKQMTWSERSAFDALSDDDDEEGTETVALLMFRFPCFEQRRILRKRAAYDFTDSCSEASEPEVAVPSSDSREQLTAMHCELESKILQESENVPDSLIWAETGKPARRGVK